MTITRFNEKSSSNLCIVIAPLNLCCAALILSALAT